MDIYWKNKKQYILVVRDYRILATPVVGVNWTIKTTVDELLSNQDLMLDIEKRIDQVDVDGNQKYQLLGEQNDLDIRDGWEEDVSRNLI